MTRIIRMGSPFPEVSICIPTFSADLDRVRKNVQFIEAYTADCEIIVVDCEGELRGYTTPQNEAMAAARGHTLVALNDDVLVSPGWCGTMRQVLHQSNAWCVTPDQTHHDGPQIFAPYCMMWWRWAWEEIGGLDEQFQWWCSDIDIARRLVDAGHTPVRTVLPVPIDHQIGATATGADQAAINEMALHDLDRFRTKWGVDAETEKVRLRDLVWSPDV